jgi:hypothetical protein
MQPTIVADRLYGISMRPHELALHGGQVSFSLRYGAICDDAAELLTRHFKLLVLEIHAQVALEPDAAPRRLELLRCGWELELSTPAPCPTADLAELPAELPRLMVRIADTVNDLARRAGLEAPLGPALVDQLTARCQRE